MLTCIVCGGSIDLKTAKRFYAQCETCYKEDK